MILISGEIEETAIDRLTKEELQEKIQKAISDEDSNGDFSEKVAEFVEKMKKRGSHDLNDCRPWPCE